MDFEYIDSPDSLKNAASRWSGVQELAIDIECENNLHCYGKYISIVQVSSREGNWIVDVLSIQEIHPLLDVLEDPSVEKVFHDVNFDLRILHHQFNCKPRNVFDTKIATHFLGMEENGLKKLLKTYFGFEQEKKFQMANWSKRPLSEEMLRYAIGDTVHLLPLRDRLLSELEAKGRAAWVREETDIICESGLAFEEQSIFQLRGVKAMTPGERAVLRRLLDLREKKAEKLNKPPFWVMRTSKLMELAKQPPSTLDEWRNLYGVHPIVKKSAKKFHDAVEKGKTEEIHAPPVERYYYNARQHQNSTTLSEMRDELSAELNMPKNLIMSKEQMQQMVRDDSLACLREWQRRLLTDRYGSRLDRMFKK